VAVVDLAVALLSTVLLLPVATMWIEGRHRGGAPEQAGGDEGEPAPAGEPEREPELAAR